MKRITLISAALLSLSTTACTTFTDTPMTHTPVCATIDHAAEERDLDRAHKRSLVTGATLFMGGFEAPAKIVVASAFVPDTAKLASKTPCR